MDARQPLDGRDFYISPLRVAFFSFFSPFTFAWWLYRFFAFARRERFLHARPFWWILVPFYDLLLLGQLFSDLKERVARQAPSSITQLNPDLIELSAFQDPLPLQRVGSQLVQRSGPLGVHPVLMVIAFVLSEAVLRTTDVSPNHWVWLAGQVGSGLLTAVPFYLLQRAANYYLRRQYPTASPRSITRGEAIAGFTGLVLFGLALLGTFGR